MFQAGLPLVARRASPVSALFAANKLELSQRPPAPGSGLKLKAGALRGAGWRFAGYPGGELMLKAGALQASGCGSQPLAARPQFPTFFPPVLLDSLCILLLHTPIINPPAYRLHPVPKGQLKPI